MKKYKISYRDFERGWKSFFVYAFTPQQVFSQVDAVTRGKKHIGIWISRYNFDGSIAKFPFFEHEYEPKR